MADGRKPQWKFPATRSLLFDHSRSRVPPESGRYRGQATRFPVKSLRPKASPFGAGLYSAQGGGTEPSRGVSALWVTIPDALSTETGEWAGAVMLAADPTKCYV
jgi:hypothetical protein